MKPSEELLARAVQEEAGRLGAFESITKEQGREVAERVEQRTGIPLTRVESERDARYGFQFARIVYLLRWRAVRPEAARRLP